MEGEKYIYHGGARLAKDLERTRRLEDVRRWGEEASRKLGGGPLISPYHAVRMTVDESVFYEMCVMTLRHAMGGGTIGSSGVFADIVQAIGFSPLAARIGSVIVDEYRDYVKRFRDGSEDGVDDIWRRGIAWLTCVRDDSFVLATATPKGGRGKERPRRVLCFKYGGELHSAASFRENPHVTCRIDPDAAKKYRIEKSRMSWREYLRLASGEAETVAGIIAEMREGRPPCHYDADSDQMVSMFADRLARAYAAEREQGAKGRRRK